MIDAIRCDRAPYIDAAAGRRALEAVLAIYQSAAQGGAVSLPMRACATTDFTGRFQKEAGKDA